MPVTAVAQPLEAIPLPPALLRREPKPSARAYVSGALPELEPELDDDACARLIAGVLAWLARYTQHSALALDLAIHRASSQTGCLQLTLDHAEPIEALSARVARALPGACATRGSNVALTLLGRDTTITRAQLHDEHALHFIIHEQDSELALLLAYDYGAFQAARIERMVEALSLALRAAQVDPGQTVRELPILSYGEARAIERLGEGPRASEADEPVGQRFGRIAREFAKQPALRCQGQTMRYDELDLRFDQLARYTPISTPPCATRSNRTTAQPRCSLPASACAAIRRPTPSAASQA